MNTLKLLVCTSAALVAFATPPSAPASETIAAADHAATAAELEQKAAVAHQKAAAHVVMARTGGAPKAAGAMKGHCDHLIAKYKAEAAEYSAQAAEHRHAAE